MGIVFDIQKYSTTNGPGIRTTAFLKGCPLRCVWCHNPESHKTESQLMYLPRLCTHCGTCVAVCPQGAHSIDGLQHRYDAQRCVLCHTCVGRCPYGALKIAGTEMTADELVKRLAEDVRFYEHSNGGATLSGGEPTLQYDFCKEVLMKLKNRGIHTALDTCGFCTEEKFRALLPYVDLLLYDIKCVDSSTHKKLTGQLNDVILRNFQESIVQNKPIRVRFPMIPGMTDTRQNIDDTITLLKQANLTSVDISFYHNLGINKWGQLFTDSPVQIHSYTQEQKDSILQSFTAAGIQPIEV